MTAAPLRVLFLCTGNTCRSQMAEGWARHLLAGRVEPSSAGVEARTAVDPRAVRVMAEAGVDISGQRPKTVDSLKDRTFDLIITLCGHAQETCPFFPGPGRVVHFGFEDPPRLAEGAATEEAALGHYRRVRDEIREFVAGLPEWLNSQGPDRPLVVRPFGH
jgi:arsenate reductase (thioredoxin)